MIKLLREIDEGQADPDKLIIISHYPETEEEEATTRISYAGDLPTITRLGLIEMARIIIYENS